MELPDFPPITPEILAGISEQHGLGIRHFTRLSAIGITNAIFPLDDHLILRIPRHHPNVIATAFREATAVPVARRLGVRTPDLVVFDASQRLLAVPYSIYERVHGDTLGLLGQEPLGTAAAYRQLGRDLALLHAGVQENDISREQVCGLTARRRPDPDGLAAAGYFSTAEARWLRNWFDRLHLMGSVPLPPRFLHGDVQGTNVMVQPATWAYRALLDWGNAGWGDVALDFVGLPLRAVPIVLEGHQEVVPFAAEEQIEARITCYQLWFALRILSRPPQPEHSWAERPLGMLLELLRFFRDPPSTLWRELGP